MGRKGFSLIELLVVVSIIGILAALLLPAIGIVRDMAKATRCASTMRQIGMACVGYAGDNDQVLPPVKWLYGTSQPGADTNGYLYWHVLITDYVDMREVSVYDATSKDPVRWGCPSWQGRSDLTGYGYWTKTGYGMNPYLAMSVNYGDLNRKYHSIGGQNPGGLRTWPLSRITRSSSRILLGDAVDYNLNPETVVSELTNPWKRDPPLTWETSSVIASGYKSGDPRRHRGRANYAFADGHVDRLEPDRALLGLADPASY